MKLHLPIFMRKAILALMLAYGVPAVQAATLTLGADDSLSVDYSLSGSLQDLNNGTLQLSGGTTLQLSSCGKEDGKTYPLLTGVSGLLGADGSAITLDDTNNAASLYFDTTQPGSGFWADAKLQLVNGALQLALHNEAVKEAMTITSNQTNPSAYQYYAGISFKDISEYYNGGAIYDGAADSITLNYNGTVTFSGNIADCGGAISGDGYITLNNNGSVVFSQNTARRTYSFGGAIYGDYGSTLFLNDNNSVHFVQNVASSEGGAISGYKITLNNNNEIEFRGNTASSTLEGTRGGAIYGGSIIQLSDNGSVLFQENKTTSSVKYASADGGAICGDSNITLNNNSSVKFHGNTASCSYEAAPSNTYSQLCGGALCGESNITLSDNGKVEFTANQVSSSSNYAPHGGAIYCAKNITANNNDIVRFCENSASASASYSFGGAIHVKSDGTITLNNNNSLIFYNNAVYSLTRDSCGGAIFAKSNNTIILNANGSIEFSGNTASSEDSYAYGGAIYVNKSNITMSHNASVTFSENTAFAGGAIYVDKSYITMSHNASVTFSENTASAGGAIYGYSSSTITLSDNGSVTFCGNTVSGSGGAIYGVHNNSSITLSNNENVSFSKNTASSFGGAICGESGSTITLISNSNCIFNGNVLTSEENSVSNATNPHANSAAQTSGGAIYSTTLKISGNSLVSFTDNKASACATSESTYGSSYASARSLGGAIYSNNISIVDNGSVTYQSNEVSSQATSSSTYSTASTSISAFGGAIYASGILTMQNNEAVLFEKNVEISDNGYRLRGIYVDSRSGVIHLSAPQNKNIEFRDSLYLSAGSSFYLNSDYTDTQGNTVKQQGDIIFTGAYTEAHLAEVKGSAGTAEEIKLSRTSEVNTMTNLLGGRLRVEDGAVYKGQGITAMEGSAATVRIKSATMNHDSYNMTFKRGTSLEVVGQSSISAKALNLEQGSTLTFKVSNENVTNAVLTFSGSLNIQGAITLSLGLEETELNAGMYKLLDLGSTSVPSSWNAQNLTVESDYFAYDNLVWQGSLLYLNNDKNIGSDEPAIPDTPVTPDEPGSDEPGGELPGGDEPGSDEPGGELPGGDEPGSDEPGGELPGGDEPGSNEPGGELPGGDEPEIPDTPVTPEKPEGNKTVRPSGNTISTSEVTSNSKLVLEGKGTLTLNGKVSPASISVNISKNLTLKGAKTGGALAGDGDLTKRGNGALTLNDGNGSWTGDTHLLAGTIKVKGTTSLGKGDVYVKGGTLHLGSKAIGNDIIQSKDAAIKSGKKFTGTYTLENGELQKGSTQNIAKTATLAGGTVNGTLSGTGKTTVTGKVKLGDKGKITTKALSLDEDATLTTSAKGLSSKATTLTIGENALFSLGGKMTVDSLKLNGGELKTTASKPAAMTVKNNMELTDATLTTNGKVTTNRLTLSESTMSIKGAKAQNLTVKQSLTLGSGSNLRLNGKLSAGSLTIRSGGTLTMNGSKPVTLKVKGSLTLNSGSSIILDYDFVQGKTYKVLTFGSYSGSSDYYSIFGVDADDCTITNTGKALTLTVTGKWNPQTQQKAVSVAAVEEPVITNAPKSATNPVADALVQANWGQLEASRAFVNAMANRSMAVQLGNGERAVWASAIGSSSRHSGANGHNGADTNVSGGAFGLETQVGRASLFGMALGNSWTRVSAHGFGTIEQDTTHLGLYGQTNWRSGVTADWSAAYGRSDSETMGSDWSQKNVQLDGRVSYNHELNANTVLSPFAGVQYYASDSAAIGTTDTGSLQNLRAEIGVAASHRVGKFGVYGEIALHQDMARNNPSVSMEGTRYTGMTPGRTGLNFTIGASYELNAQWSVNASYTGEFVENANAHSANVGASYKF